MEINNNIPFIFYIEDKESYDPKIFDINDNNCLNKKLYVNINGEKYEKNVEFIVRFIDWYFDCYNKKGEYYGNVHIYMQRRIILNDIMLLKNQIPLKDIIQKFKIIYNYNDEDIFERLRNIIHLLYPFKETSNASTDFGISINNIFKILDIKECINLIDINYKLITYQNNDINRNDKNDNYNSRYRIPTISKLVKSGIKVKSYKGNIRDIKYNNKTLYLPQIRIYENTKSYFKNILIYENNKKEKYILQYVILMDDLIDTDDDVELLIKFNVIINNMQYVSDITKIWNNINQHMLINQTHEWSNMMCSINKDFNNVYNRLLYEFRKRYFSRPWFIMSFLAAILLLLLTLLQTIYTIISYYN